MKIHLVQEAIFHFLFPRTTMTVHSNQFGKPTNSDLELSVLNEKIGNIESILERVDLKVAEVNAFYIENKTELIKTVDDSLNRFMKDTDNRIELLE